MTKKFLTAMMMMISLMFAQSDYFNKETVKPFIFSVLDAEKDYENPNAEKSTNFHLTLFSGRVKNVYGLQLGLIANSVSGDFLGLDATGIYSGIKGNFAGYQTSGIVGKIEGEVTGIQESGIYSYAGGNFLGIQNTGIAGKIAGDLQGLQLSGIVSTAEEVRGGQFSGIVNNAKDVVGLQHSGIVNNALDVTGVQAAGIINNAGHVRGVQVGLINRSKKLDGIALGLINISDEGRVHPTAWAGGASDYQAGLKFAPNNYWYSVLSVGDIQDSEKLGNCHTIHSYVGLQYSMTKRFWIAGDIGSGIALPYNLDKWEDKESIWGIFESRISAGFQIFERLSIYGGISHSYLGHDDNHEEYDEFEKSRPFFGIQF
ncbi:MAG: hypothetical protein JXQ65_11780 [Candidatus Marinimicrobia bacterium]|nr:hypothetical protein [Candidatus Neomarinimicrobiota bacterium]